MASIKVRAGFALVEISMSLHLGGGELFSDKIVDGFTKRGHLFIGVVDFGGWGLGSHAPNKADTNAARVLSSHVSALSAKFSPLLNGTITLDDEVVAAPHPTTFTMPAVNIFDANIHIGWGV